MSNILPRPLLSSNPQLQAAACKYWLRREGPNHVTHFLTVSLKCHQSDVDPEKWNTRTAPQRAELIEQTIRRFDKRLYGRSHMRMAAELKFAFLMLEETRDKRKQPTFAHLHGALGFTAKELAKLPLSWPRIKMDIEKLVRARGLEPDIELVSADNGVIDYIAKDALFQLDLINTRATM